MPKREVFLEREVRCPSCKETSTLRYPNPRLYVAAKRDTDMRVIEYRWGEGVEETHVKPHYYDVWQCPRCKYADFTAVLTNHDLVQDSMRAIDEYRSLEFKKQMVLTALEKTFGKSDDLFLAALGKHLAALYINYLPEKERRNHNKIGRLALRISWLFKEKGGVETTGKSEDSGESRALKALNETSSRLDSSLLTVRDLLAEATSNAEAVLTELGLDPEESDSEEQSFTTTIDSLNDKLEEMTTLNTMLQRAILTESHREPDLTDGETDSEQRPEFVDKLLEIKKLWAELPLNEDASVHLSIEAFDYSYNHENYYQSIEQSMTVVALIVDLYGRIGEYREALGYVGEIYRNGMRMKQELQARIAHGRKHNSLSKHDERMINRKVGNINTAIRQAGEKRRELLNIVLKKLTPKIKEILAAVANATYQEQVAALKKNEIPEEIIIELKNRKLLAKEKKGLFG